MAEKGTTDQYFRLEGLKQFRIVDVDRIFQEQYELISAYPLNKDIRFLLENVTFNSPNENIVIYVTLEDATDAILPIDLIRGGQPIGLDNLLEIRSVRLYRKSIYIKVGAIQVDDYVLKSGNVLELIELETPEIHVEQRRVDKQEVAKEPKEEIKSKGMSLAERVRLMQEKGE